MHFLDQRFLTDIRGTETTEETHRVVFVTAEVATGVIGSGGMVHVVFYNGGMWYGGMWYVV